MPKKRNPPKPPPTAPLVNPRARAAERTSTPVAASERFADLVQATPIVREPPLTASFESSDRSEASLTYRRRAASGPERVAFVVERSENYVEGYRSELGRGALATLSRGRWLPHLTVDLHGLRANAVRPTLERAISPRHERPMLRVLIIVGKGLHSDRGGGVLADAVLEAITEGPLAHRVRAFTVAPNRLGGTGALAVEMDPDARKA